MEIWGGNEATCSAFEKAGVDIWLYSRPCGNDTNGGDLYYLSSCASGRITRMLVADVAGHGKSVAAVSSGLRGLMHRYINTIRPQRLFEEVNEEFSKLSAADRFATSVISSYFMPTGTLSICSAGHPTPLIRRAAARHWEMLEIPETNHEITGNIPLGIGEFSTYNQLDIPVQTGDMVVCFTDGVIESADSTGELLGIAGLQAILNGVPVDQPDQILSQVVDRLTSNDKDFSRKDDVTMLLYRITNRAVPLRDNLAAPFRWVKSLFRKQI